VTLPGAIDGDPLLEAIFAQSLSLSQKEYRRLNA
jgi:hypothetical protein